MKLKHSFYQNSACLNGYLHRFIIIGEYDEGVMECCEICKKTRFFRIIEGKVDNSEYMSYHVRQALPDFHPLFYHEHVYDPFSDEKIISPYI